MRLTFAFIISISIRFALLVIEVIWNQEYSQLITKAGLAAQGLAIFSFALSYRLKSFDFASPVICSETSRYYTFVISFFTLQQYLSMCWVELMLVLFSKLGLLSEL